MGFPANAATTSNAMTNEEELLARIAQLEERIQKLERHFQCPKCSNEAEPEHSCPYYLRSETDFTCTCCDDCRRSCAQAN